MLHKWEEPLLVGEHGAGAVFFSGCSLRCVYCQNAPISRGNFGRELTSDELCEAFRRLVMSGAATLDLVTPTQYLPQIADALDLYAERYGRLPIPTVFNSGGYERADTLREYGRYFDVYLPDFKYADAELAAKYSSASDYFDTALSAIREMVRQRGECVIENGVMKSGVIIRHLVLPGARRDSERILRTIASEFGTSVMVSIMRQYTPPGDLDPKYKPLDRRVCSFEYNAAVDLAAELGLVGFTQERESADSAYTPDFDGDLME